MKKAILTTVFALSAIFYSHAQQGSIYVNGGIDLGMPLGDFGEAFGLGYGATFKGLYGISETGQVGLTLGYQTFGMKDSPGGGVSASMGITPLFVLYRHYLSNLYVEPQVGLSINSVKFKGMSGLGGMSASDNSLGYAVGAGYLIGDIDISVRYQGLTQSGENSGFIGFRVGYNFDISRLKK